MTVFAETGKCEKRFYFLEFYCKMQCNRDFYFSIHTENTSFNVTDTNTSHIMLIIDVQYN